MSGERIPPGSVSATPAARHSIMSRGKMPAALWTYKDSRRDIIHSRIAGSFRPPRIKINNIKVPAENIWTTENAAELLGI